MICSFFHPVTSTKLQGRNKPKSLIYRNKNGGGRSDLYLRESLALIDLRMTPFRSSHLGDINRHRNHRSATFLQTLPTESNAGTSVDWLELSVRDDLINLF